jgi:hypothetical protein
MQRISTATLRSICTQTESCIEDEHRAVIPNDDLLEEFHILARFDDPYFRSLSTVVSNNSDSSEAEPEVKPTPQIRTRYPEPRVNASETSTASSQASSTVGYVFGHGLTSFQRQLLLGERGDLYPGRIMLIAAWCIYSMVVVSIAQPMLPYMILLTLFFLILILK